MYSKPVNSPECLGRPWINCLIDQKYPIVTNSDIILSPRLEGLVAAKLKGAGASALLFLLKTAGATDALFQCSLHYAKSEFSENQTSMGQILSLHRPDILPGSNLTQRQNHKTRMALGSSPEYRPNQVEKNDALEPGLGEVIIVSALVLDLDVSLLSACIHQLCCEAC